MPISGATRKLVQVKNRFRRNRVVRAHPGEGRVSTGLEPSGWRWALRDGLVGAVVEDVLSAVSDLEAVASPRDAAAVLWSLDLRSGSPG